MGIIRGGKEKGVCREEKESQVRHKTNGSVVKKVKGATNVKEKSIAGGYQMSQGSL